MRTTDVAHILKVTSSTILKWIHEGRLKATRYTPGGPYRIDQADLDEFLRACSVNTPPNVNSQFKTKKKK